MALEVSTPYDSVRLIVGSNMESWLNPYDALRLASYQVYQNMYFNSPDTFKLWMRGTNERPIYIPSAKIIVNTVNRYLCRNMTFVADPLWGDAKSRELLMAVFGVLFKRERFYSKFNTNKLFGVIRGDAAFMITANADKPEGSRVSIESVDPGGIFPIPDPDDEFKTIGVDLVEQILIGDTTVVRRQRYMKSNHPDHPAYTEPPTYDGEIAYQVDTYELEGWEDPENAKKAAGAEQLAAEIIPGITHLPVYVWKNFDEPENPWGRSELSGLETVLAGVNQAVSDQDLALAISGLGLYVTDAGAPVNDAGQEVPWQLGPAEVVEIGDGKTFDRVKGVDTVTPSLEHIRYLQEQAYRTTGTSDVAQGQMEVSMAESGIALQLRLGPILDEVAIKEQLIMDVVNQMFFDLKQWLEVYEGLDFGEYDPMDPVSSPTVVCKPGEKIPENKAERRKFLLEGYNALPAVFSGSYVRAELRRMGDDIPDDAEMMRQIAEEAEFFSTATDPEGARLEEEAIDDGLE